VADSSKLELVHKAIRSGVLGLGHIQWGESAGRLIRDDPDFGPLTLNGIRALLRQFVMSGKTLDIRRETRVEYLHDNPDDPFWYRAIIDVPGLAHGLFLEVKLIDDDPGEPWIEIVSAHRQLN
jgi:hypothetical protein